MDADTRAHAGGAGVVDPVTGHLLDGRYRVGRRIARGGMASVYEALDTRLDRVCAVKIMHPGLGDDASFADRFKREARAAARLNHPHVVNVFDQGDDPDIDGGTLYLVMELVPGHTLRDVIRDEAPMNPAKALAVMEPIVSALAAAHRSGLIHRDIKPENVLIADDGRVKVADFGLAKAVSADTQHTATGGVIIGTVSYLAPELVVDGTSDARADVYAAGVVLYELLTGEKPHAGESPIAVAYKHVHEDVPPPSRLAPAVPAYLDALVARATARDRAQRPADAGVLLHQLHRVSQALAGGVWDDQELTSDLALPAAKPSPEPVTDDTNAFEILPIAEPEELTAPTARPVFEPQRLAGLTGRPPAQPPLRRLPWPPHRPCGRAGRAAVRCCWSSPSCRPAGGYRRLLVRLGPLHRDARSPGAHQQAAVAKLEHAGLDAELGDPAFSETVPKGEVVATDPGPGAKVLHHGTVTVTMSLGKERFAVPKVARLTVDQAQDALLEAASRLRQVDPESTPSAPKGMVLGTDPAAGRREPGASRSTSS